MQLGLDDKDRIIRNIARKYQPIRHFELRKIIVKDKEIMSAGTFERRTKNMIKRNALPYIIVDKMKFYSFNLSIPQDAQKSLLMKTGLQSADINIAKMKKLFPKLLLDEKAEFATSCILSVLANIFDILKHHVDKNPKVVVKWRLLVQYQQKLREIYDIIRADADRDIVEFFVDARCRPNPNQLEEGEFGRYLETRYLGSIWKNSEHNS